jgi:hypothetical protein
MPLRADQNPKVALTALDDISDIGEDPRQPPPLSEKLSTAASGLSMPGKPGEKQEENTHCERHLFLYYRWQATQKNELRPPRVSR